MAMHTFIGHRGIRNHAPENTAKGFALCAEYFKWVEFDATLTADKKVVLFHDETIDDLSNSTGNIGDLTADNLKAVNIQGEPIPSLGDSIVQMQNLGLHMNLEIKDNDSRWKLLTDKIIDVVNNTYSNKTKLLFSSFNHDALVHLRDKMPNAVIGHLFEYELDNWQAQAQAVQAISVHFSNENIAQSIVDKAKDLGYLVYVYTVNNKAEYDKLISWGVDGVFTDEKPEIFE